MSQTLAPSPEVMEQQTDTEPERPELTDRLPPALRAPRGWALLAGVLALTFWYAASRPLWHTDVWGHVTYGQWIWNHRAVPDTEPLLPLSQGVSFTDTAWLSELGSYFLVRGLGAQGLQLAFAISVTLAVSLLAWIIQRKTKHAGWTTLGLALFLGLNSQQYFVGSDALWRPQMFGQVAFVALFAWLTAAQLHRRDWFLIPALFILWGNTHGSFLMGLALIAAFTLGRAVDLWRRTGHWSAALKDPRCIHWGLILELSAAAVLINPYGFGLYTEVLNFSHNPNLQELVEWEPLNIRRGQGQIFVALMLSLAMLYRYSPRRVSFTEVLLLGGLGAWTMWTSRMLVWWTVPAVYFLVLHAQACWSRYHHAKLWNQSPSPRGGLWTVAMLGLIWIGFAMSPIGVRLLHRRTPEFSKTVSAGTPIHAVEYLRKTPPQGLVFSAFEWGDYLLWQGPQNVQVFCNSHAHLIPAEVWQSYLSIRSGSAQATDLLDRYGVNTVLVDLERHDSLISALKKNPDWEERYRDGLAIILTRKKTI